MRLILIDDDDANEENNSKKKQDISETIRPNKSDIIELVMLTMDTKGYKMAKVKCRSARVLQNGDAIN